MFVSTVKKLCPRFFQARCSSSKTLLEQDKALIWHPFTQARTAPPTVAIKSASGSYLYDYSGRAYLDLVSSWWTNLHGHGHPEIAEAIYLQAKSLDHIMFAGFTHEPAVALSAALTTVLPTHLTRFFFTDDGSTAVEASLKMAYQFWLNRGQERNHFLCFEGGYHGDTFGAMAVGRGSGYHDPFGKLLFNTLLIPFPATWQGDTDVEAKEAQALTVLQRHLEVNSKTVAAMILEPLVQGASGMRMCRKEFLEKVIITVKNYGSMIIFDEVMTGFGRTGRIFAHAHLSPECHPDFLCLSKGLTGGVMPLALTVTTETVYEGFLGADFKSAFAHGHSYTANPIACAAAQKSLEILQRPETTAAIVAIERAHAQGLKRLTDCAQDLVGRQRVQGTIASFEISKTFENLNLNKYLKEEFVSEGIILRPLNSTVYLMPPYSTTPTHISNAYEIILKVLKKIAKLN